MVTRIVCALALCLTNAAFAQLPTWKPAKRDPSSRPSKYVEPTQVVVFVEHIEVRTDPGDAQKIADMERQVQSATASDKPKLEKVLNSERDKAARRSTHLVSGHMAVMGDGDGRFNDRSPHVKYYDVGTVELLPKHRVDNLQLYQYLLLSSAEGGEGAEAHCAFCVPTARPRTISRPSWWKSRDPKFSPPWENVNHSSARTGVLTAEIAPNPKPNPHTLSHSGGSFIRRAVTVRNVTQARLSNARIALRFKNAKGDVLGSVHLTNRSAPVKPKGKVSRKQPFPELGDRAMTIDVNAVALFVEMLHPNESQAIEVYVPQAYHEAIASAEAVVLYSEP